MAASENTGEKQEKGTFPNRSTQFKPGQSGNPAGKPKGALHLTTHIQNMLNDEDFTTYLADARDGWKEFKGAPIKAIVQTAMIKAIQGDDKAREWLAKYGYGQKLEVEHSGGVQTNTRDLSQEELDERIKSYLERHTTG